MIPGIFPLLPNFALIRDLGMMNTMGGMMLPSMLMTPFAIFFLRQFFLSMPQEVEEAAMLDGLHLAFGLAPFVALLMLWAASRFHRKER